MDEMNRRVLLSTIGVVGAAAMVSRARAGPLNPPAGAIASTGRTVDEIYNRIPAVGGFDGRIPIPGGTTPITLSQPGSYVLTGNLTTPGTAILIAAANVTLDLNGFRVTCTSTGTAAVAVSTSASYPVIRSGSISGG